MRRSDYHGSLFEALSAVGCNSHEDPGRVLWLSLRLLDVSPRDRGLCVLPGVCVRVNVRCVWVAFVWCCFACDCVLELVVCRVRFARV